MRPVSLEDRRVLRSITLRNLLSFGPEEPPFELENLNVLIGPNGSGKSNLIEAVGLLRAAPHDMRDVIRKGGGVTEWIWKGSPKGTASVEVNVENPQGPQQLRHVIRFAARNQAFQLEHELVARLLPSPGVQMPCFSYDHQTGRTILWVEGEERRLDPETVQPDLSILAQRRDPESYPEISYLADTYGAIRIYREWTFGRNAIFREPQKADMRNDRLEEDFSNLGLFLNRLRRMPRAKNAVLAGLRDLYERLSDFDVSVEGGTVQVFFTEGDYTIPATRLSDGTLRYLCLLAILCDPEPPPLVCIEEPELGLHPDILPKVADLLVAASDLTQLIVTTHSDILVDAMTERPEAVIVCENREGQTTMRRLEAEALAGWLERYRLGELWTKGELGGTRW